MKTLSLVLLLATPVIAQPALNLPRLGCLRDSLDQLRIVYGVRGSFILSAPIATKVTAFVCSDTRITVQTPQALIAFDQKGIELARLDLEENAPILLEVLVFDGKQWTSQEGGSPPSGPPVAKLATCIPKLEDGKLTLCDDTLSDLPPVLSIEQIGPDWLHVRTAGGPYAVTLRDRKPEAYLLPANPPDPGEGQ